MKKEEIIKRYFLFNIILIFVIIFSGGVSATTYYVANNGSDSNDGLTEQTPWQTIGKANQQLIPNDTVIIMGGEYDEISPTGQCDGMGVTLRPAMSGTPGNYIIYKGHPDYPKPVIKGGGVSVGTHYAVCLEGRSWIILDNIEVTESFRGIYLNAVSNIIVQNCTVHDTTGPQNNNNGGVFVGFTNSADNVTVRGCELYRNWQDHDNNPSTPPEDCFNCNGILLYRTTNSIVEDNEAWGHPAGGHGIRLKWLDSSNIVRRNIVHDVGVGIVHGGGSVDGYAQIYENIIYNTNDAGIVMQTDGIGDVRNVSVWNNVVYECNTSGIGLYPQNSIPNFQSYNNILVNCVGGHFNEEDDWIIGENLIAESDNHPNLQSDYNIFYDDFETDVVNWHGTVYDLSQHQSANPTLDQNSMQQDPLFVDAANYDFHLQPGSPAIDAGELIPGYHCQYADDDPVNPMDPNADCRHWSGSAPDIGAFEYVTGAPTCTSDTNNDAVVNIIDLALVAYNQGQDALDPDYDHLDVNEDGVIDFGDVSVVISNFGQDC